MLSAIFTFLNLDVLINPKQLFLGSLDLLDDFIDFFVVLASFFFNLLVGTIQILHFLINRIEVLFSLVFLFCSLGQLILNFFFFLRHGYPIQLKSCLKFGSIFFLFGVSLNLLVISLLLLVNLEFHLLFDLIVDVESLHHLKHGLSVQKFRIASRTYLFTFSFALRVLRWERTLVVNARGTC